mgnify:CR=1 FL=1
MKLSYLDLMTTDPSYNLAMEQYVFDCLPRDRMYFMLWQNDNAIIVGKYQNTISEINEEAVRERGIRVQLYAEQKKFKAKMNYADKLGVPYVVFLGDDEIAAGLVACKDMTSGDQTKLSFEDTLSRITQGLSQRNQGKVILEK